MNEKRLQMIEESNLHLYFIHEYLETFTRNPDTTNEALRNFISRHLEDRTNGEVSFFIENWLPYVFKFREHYRRGQIVYLRKYGWSIDRIRRRVKASPNWVLEKEKEYNEGKLTYTHLVPNEEEPVLQNFLYSLYPHLVKFMQEMATKEFEFKKSINKK